MQMYSSGPNPAPSTMAPRIGEWLSEAWDLFKQQWQVYIVQSLICMVATGIIVAIAYAVFFGAMFASIAAAGRNSDAAAGGILLAYVLMFMVMMALQVFIIILYAGIERTAAKQMRGEPIAVGDMFTAFDVIGNLFLAGILMGIASMIGVAACYIGAFVVIGATVFVLPLVVEGRVPAVEAMRRSWEAARPHLLMYILWAFVISLIGSLGAYLCGIGMIATMPIYCIAQMVAYRDIFGIPGALPGRVAVAAGVPQATPPPVDYGPAGPPVVGGQCPSCGRPVAAGAVRCPACGAALTGAGRMAAPAPPPDAPAAAPDAPSFTAPPSTFTPPPTVPSTVPPAPGSAAPSPPLTTPEPPPVPGGAHSHPAAEAPVPPPPPGTSTSPAVPPDAAPAAPPTAFGTPPPPTAPGSGMLGTTAPQSSPPPGTVPPTASAPESTGETGWQSPERPVSEPPPAAEENTNPPSSP